MRYGLIPAVVHSRGSGNLELVRSTRDSRVVRSVVVGKTMLSKLAKGSESEGCYRWFFNSRQEGYNGAVSLEYTPLHNVISWHKLAIPSSLG